MKVFLGGTVNGSNWRRVLIPKLKVDYFDPVVPEWNDEAWQRELKERKHCDFVLYVITPKLVGYYSLAEVVDDSYERPDRCLYCYLPVDEDDRFSDEQIVSCERLGRKVVENGGLWLRSLDEIAELLNSAEVNLKSKIHFKQDYNNVFISYGRRHSLAFASKLTNALGAKEITSWFDMNDIPLGVDFQEQIDQGIENADNFIFIISPHSVKSEYCLREISLAVKYGKRIIPILHIEPADCWDKMHPVIEKLNWVYMRERLDDSIPQDQWQQIERFETKLSDLVNLIDVFKEPVRMHTILLHLAVQWDANQRLPERLLVGKDRMEAIQWLTTKEFKNQEGVFVQAPYRVVDIQAEFICESEKNHHNLMSDVFFSFASENRELEHKIALALMRNAITSWTHDLDIKKGSNFDEAILRGVEQADNVVYLISKEAAESEYCQLELDYALKLNKRILPLLIEKTKDPYQYIPKKISSLQYIDFTCALDPEGFVVPKGMENRREKTPFDKKVAVLLAELLKERGYYNLHKVFLAQGLKWERQSKNDSVLLRGYSLENAKSWLELGALQTHKPLPIHHEYIAASDAKAALITSLDVFISYSRTDSEFARLVNENLQLSGKTTWFDQESIASGADFQAEINKGIESSDNFLFIISPDSVNSVYCSEEVQYAKAHNKRFVTILCRPTNAAKIHPDLASVQWIDFTKKDFLISFGELVRTLELDREHVKDHTKWAIRSTEWLQRNESKDLLLKGSEFILALNWLERADEDGKKPSPIPVQRQFIEASQKAIFAAEKQERRRVRTLWLLLALAFVLLVVSVYVSIIAFSRKEVADRAAKEAVKSKIEADMERYNAEKEKKKADEERANALVAENVAVEAKQTALVSLAQAQRDREKAQKYLKEVQDEKNATEEQRKRAMLNYEKAISAEMFANEEKDRAMFQLYLFNAKEFANKSIQMQNNRDLKALLALTSYQLKTISTKLSSKNGYQMQNDPEVLEALQISYMSFNKNLVYPGALSALEMSSDGLAFSQSRGALCLADLKASQGTKFPSLHVRDSIQLLHDAYLHSVAFTEKGDKFVCGTSDGRLMVYDFASKSKQSNYICRKTIIYVSFFERESIVVAESSDGNTYLYDYSKNKLIGSSLPIRSLVHVSGKDFLCLDERGNIQACELVGARLSTNQLTYNTNYKSLSVNVQMRLVVAVANNGELFVYRFDPFNLDALMNRRAVQLPYIHSGIRPLVKFSADNKWLATGSLDGYICLWPLDDKKTEFDRLVPIIISSNKKQIFTLCFDPQSKYLFYGDNNLHIYPLDMDKIYSQLSSIMGRKTLSEQKWQYYKRGELDKPE